MPVDLVIKGGRIVTPTGVVEAGLAVDDGKISAVVKEALLPRADRILKVDGLLVLPGLIDAHVHICDPGFTHESFETGTQAAAAGGVTTIIDMASSMDLRTSSIANFLRKKELAAKQVFVDFALYGGEISDERDLLEVEELVEAGVVGFGEIMMCGDTPIRDEEMMLKALLRISKAGSTAAVHAEDNNIISECRKKLIAEGRKDVAAFADGRPNQAEAKAISRALLMSQKAHARLHVCHLSTKEGKDLVRKAKARRLLVTTEVCPHHLFFTKDAYEKLGPSVITTPPLRTIEDVTGLWRGLNDGTIDLIVSDHCAFKKLEKNAYRQDIWHIPAGVPGLETLALLMLGKGVKEGKISLQRFVEVASENPAKLFKLYPRKGSLEKGADADLTIVNLHKDHVIKAEDLKCIADYTPYEGWIVGASLTMTLVRGEIVFNEGEIAGKMGFGNFVKPD
jgi:D-hydantoinase